MPRSRLPMLFLVFVFAAGGAALVILGTRDNSPSSPQEEGISALTVTEIRPRQAEWPVTLAASGAIVPWQEASISTQVGGYQLIDVLVNVGDPVEKGQVLARINPALLEAEEDRLVAVYEQSKADRARAEKLKVTGAISSQTALEIVTRARTAAADLAFKQLQLNYTEVRAPDDGTISARTATLGSVVASGEELFRLIRQDRLEWRGQLTAEQLARTGVGQEVSLDLPDGRTASAVVRQMSPSFNEETRLATVYADIAPASSARAGMYAAGSIKLGHSYALVVPSESVVIRDGRSHVFTLLDNKPLSRVSLQRVEIGRRRGNEIEVAKGLRGDERIVVKGAGFLNDRDVVRIVSAAQGAGALQP